MANFQASTPLSDFFRAFISVSTGRAALGLATTDSPSFNALFLGGVAPSALKVDMPLGGTYGINGSVALRGFDNLDSWFFGKAGNATSTGYSNTGGGANSLAANTSGYNNSALGSYTLLSNTVGTYNCAMGSSSLALNTTGSFNSSFGAVALYVNTTGVANCANGSFALFSNTTGSFNSAFGYQTLYEVTSGSANTAVGSNTGRGIADGSGNTIIGADVPAQASSLTNNIILASGGVVRSQFDGTSWLFQGKLKGQLTTHTNYTVGTFSATGYLTIYDATGTAYRVPCRI